MPVRSSRAEWLVLRPAGGGAPVTLFSERRGAGDLTTQDIFQVSPGGAYLAYAAGSALHVRAADGSERTIADYQRAGEMRFSPDGQRLAAVVGEAEHHRVIVFDLAAGTTRELGRFELVRQLEWMKDAIVVQVLDARRETIRELPLAGEPRVLLERGYGELDRFVAAATGTRIVAFVRDREGRGTHVLALDAATSAEPRELGVVHDSITNAAASLDGEHVAFTTAVAVFELAGDERPRAISPRDHVHSLWFARDGRLGYASDTSVTILDGTRAQRFDGDGPIRMLRFDPTSSAALVAAAHAWDAAAAKPQRIGSVAAGEDLLGVDRFAGGLVLWTR